MGFSRICKPERITQGTSWHVYTRQQHGQPVTNALAPYSGPQDTDRPPAPPATVVLLLGFGESRRIDFWSMWRAVLTAPGSIFSDKTFTGQGEYLQPPYLFLFFTELVVTFMPRKFLVVRQQLLAAYHVLHVGHSNEGNSSGVGVDEQQWDTWLWTQTDWYLSWTRRDRDLVSCRMHELTQKLIKGTTRSEKLQAVVSQELQRLGSYHC